jgi:outer membrane receptor protein involved in Fe transport
VTHATTRLAVGLAVFVLCAVQVETAGAQTGKLTGIVTDAQSGAPLEGAQLILQGTGISALTGSNGRYFIVNVPPATYTVLVRRIGYTSAEVRNVFVQIDVTRTVDVQLSPAGAVGVEEIVVSAEEVPLVQPGVTGSGSNIRQEEIQALPVTDIQGVLSLQQGFLEVPQNTDIISFTDTRRNPATPVRIRGGRGGETLTLIDGIPINNFVFGGPAFDITNEAVEQVDFQRGGFEPQYGNALSGIINIATREGGTNLAGAVSYQTSAVGGALGNTPDELSDFDLFQGYLSGPIPGTNNALRFMAAGRNTSGADRVLEFDTLTYRYSDPYLNQNGLDLFPGWRAFGYDRISDFTGKLTYYFQPTMKLSGEYIGYRRQRLPFDFDYMLTNYNQLQAPGVISFEDSLAVSGGDLLSPSRFETVIQGSVRVKRDMVVGRWDHTIGGRWFYKLAGGWFGQSRETCNYLQGVCLGNRFSDPNFTGDQFIGPGISSSHPAGGTDEFFGGEKLDTYVGRVDVSGQATDHHQIQFGAFYQQHKLQYSEFRNQGTNDVFSVPSFYKAEPWDAALYIQDRIEYDFLTVKLGLRYDFGAAGGTFFADPRDPTNGTTAREWCNGQIPGRSDTAWTNGTLSGLEYCASDLSLLAAASDSAQFDDFSESQTRTQFSPRIGVSFPLTERSQVFFNFGRYSQNPLYNNIYQNTGIGTIAGDEDVGGQGVCDEDQVIPGTTQCHPIIFNDTYTLSFLGNPNLLIEKTTSYEIGFATEIGDNFALQVLAFSKDQFGLSGIRDGGELADGTQVFDVGQTYGNAQYNYSVIVNQDFQTVRGFEVSLRRRLFNFWGFNINYAFSQATTNAAAPDQSFQRTNEEGDPVNFQELRSEVDQPHVFNSSLFFRVANENAFNQPILDAIVRNAQLTFTMQVASGLPYTPTTSFDGTGDNQLEQNSGRGPTTFRLDAFAAKDFTLTNLRFGVFLRLVNLLDRQNCQQVYATTGNCDAGAVDQSRNRQGNNAPSNTTTTYFNRAQYYGERRSFNFGVRMSF